MPPEIAETKDEKQEQLRKELDQLNAEIQGELKDLQALIDNPEAKDLKKPNTADIFKKFQKATALVDLYEDQDISPVEMVQLLREKGSEVKDEGLAERLKAIDGLDENFITLGPKYDAQLKPNAEEVSQANQKALAETMRYLNSKEGRAARAELRGMDPGMAKVLSAKDFEGMLRENAGADDDQVAQWMDAFGYGREHEQTSMGDFKRLVVTELIRNLGDQGDRIQALAERYDLPEDATDEEILAEYLYDHAGEDIWKAMKAEAAQEKADVVNKKETVSSVLEEYPDVTDQIQDLAPQERGAKVGSILREKYDAALKVDLNKLKVETEKDGVTLKKNEVDKFMHALGLESITQFKDGEVVERRIRHIENQFEKHAGEVLDERAKYAELGEIELGKGKNGEVIITNLDEIENPEAKQKVLDMIDSIPELYWGTNFANAYVQAIKEGKGGMLKDFATWKAEDAREESTIERLMHALRFLFKNFQGITNMITGEPREDLANPHMSQDLREALERSPEEIKKAQELYKKTQELNGEKVKAKEGDAETSDESDETEPVEAKIKVSQTDQILSFNGDKLEAWESIIDLEAESEDGSRDRMNAYLQRGLQPKDLLALHELETNEEVESISELKNEAGEVIGYEYKVKGDEDGEFGKIKFEDLKPGGVEDLLYPSADESAELSGPKYQVEGTELYVSSEAALGRLNNGQRKLWREGVMAEVAKGEGAHPYFQPNSPVMSRGYTPKEVLKIYELGVVNKSTIPTEDGKGYKLNPEHPLIKGNATEEQLQIVFAWEKIRPGHLSEDAIAQVAEELRGDLFPDLDTETNETSGTKIEGTNLYVSSQEDVDKLSDVDKAKWAQVLESVGADDPHPIFQKDHPVMTSGYSPSDLIYLHQIFVEKSYFKEIKEGETFGVDVEKTMLAKDKIPAVKSMVFDWGDIEPGRARESLNAQYNAQTEAYAKANAQEDSSPELSEWKVKEKERGLMRQVNYKHFDGTQKNEHYYVLKGLHDEGALSNFTTEGEGDNETLRTIDYTYSVSVDGSLQNKTIRLVVNEMKDQRHLADFIEKKKDEQLGKIS